MSIRSDSLTHSLDVKVPLVARVLGPQDAKPAVADEHRVVDPQDVRIPRSDPRDLKRTTTPEFRTFIWAVN